MKKSNWKLNYINPSLFKLNLKQNKMLDLSNFRNSIIPIKFVGKKVSIYNGAWLLTKTLDDQMVGFKFGDFSITKQFEGQAQDKRKTKKKNKK